MAEVIDYTLMSLESILYQANSHWRIKKLIDRIFMVGINAVEEQASILMEMKSKPNQMAWVWEEYAEEYYERKKIFYDGNSYVYISDIIYRIYQKATQPCNFWEDCIKEFLKRWEKLKDYSYSYLYLAAAQYERALELEKSEKMLMMSLETLRQLSPDDSSEMGYTIECKILYYLKDYQEVLNIYSKAKGKYGKSSNMEECARVAFFSVLEIMGVYNRNIEKFRKMLNKAIDCYSMVPINMLDGAKRYIPMFDFWLKYKAQQHVQIELIQLFFDLIEISSVLMEQLCFCENSAELGYYTSLSSLYCLLNDDREEIKHRISLFDARYMNDPNEGKVLAEYLGKIKRKNYKRSGELKRWNMMIQLSF